MRNILLVLALLAPAAARADDTTAAFLKIGVGARPIGMGSAYTALADDVNAVHWNPAGLAQLKRREFGAMDAQMFADTRLDFVGFAQPTRHGTLAMSALHLSQGSIEGRAADRSRTSNFTAADTSMALSFARPVGAVSLGLTGKVIQSRIADESAETVAFDAGVIGRTGVDGLSFGFALQNAGPGMKFIHQRSKLPLTGNAGLALRLPIGLILSADFKRNIHDGKNSFSMGTEMPVMKVLALRAGYLSAISGGATPNGQKLQDAKGLGAGMGMKIQNFSVDYAFTPMGELGSSQRLSVGVRF